MYSLPWLSSVLSSFETTASPQSKLDFERLDGLRDLANHRVFRADDL